MAEKTVIETDEAPEAVGAYSQGVATDDLVFTAGQIPITPAGKVLGDEPIAVQTEQSLTNVEAILAEEGLGMDDVLKTTVYLTDIDDFDEVNETYRSFFDADLPARTAVEVRRLADDADIEIEAVATH